MKPVILFFSILFLSTGLQAQSATLDSLTHHRNLKAGDFRLNIPGWMLRTGLRLAGEENEATRTMQSLRKGLRKTEVMILDNIGKSSHIMARILNEYKDDGFEEYVQIRDGGDHVSILVKEKDDFIRNMVITINEENNQFVAIQMKTKLKLEELADVIHEASKM